MNPFRDKPSQDARATEARNPKSEFIDRASAREIARIINEEDMGVPAAVAESLDDISRIMEETARAFRDGGRLIYFGAGTSGRLAVLDASECPPTFGVPADRVVAYIAGGDTALRSAVEFAEDDPDGGLRDVCDANIGPTDVVVGVAASGRTPYVVGAIEEASRRGARTGAVVAVPADRCSIKADVIVSLPVGPEVIAGSTRMKAGTATKMALNMISTGAMILTGRVYRNMMIDLRPGSAKLRDRAVRILRDATEIDEDAAIRLLDQVNGQVKLAVVIAKTGLDVDESRNLLTKEQGFAYRIIDSDRSATKTAEDIQHDTYSGGADDSIGRLRQNETPGTSTDDRKK